MPRRLIPEEDRRILSNRGFDYGSCIGHNPYALLFNGTCSPKAAHNIPVSQKEYEEEAHKSESGRKRYCKEAKPGDNGPYILYTKSVSLNGKCCVIRTFPRLRNPGEEERLISIGKFMRHLHNKHIVKVYDYHVGPRYYYLVMEYLRGGTLRKFFEKVGLKLDEWTAFQMIRQMLDGVKYLHLEQVYHGKLSVDSVMLQHEWNYKTKIAIMVIKVSDLPYGTSQCGPEKDIHDLAQVIEEIITRTILSREVYQNVGNMMDAMKNGQFDTMIQVWQAWSAILSTAKQPESESPLITIARFYKSI